MKQNSVLLRQSFPERNRRFLSCPIIIIVLVAVAWIVCGIGATPCFAGNTSAQEYADPVYRENSFQSSNNADHAALFAGVAADNTLRIIHAQDVYDCIRDGSLSEMSNLPGKQYWGAYNLNNRTLSFSNRRNIMTTAIELRDENLWWVWYDCLNPWVGTTGTIKPEDICDIRCDGLVEYCYEYKGFDVWGKNGSHYNVSNSNYCGEHNNLYYGGSGNANTELAPVVQRGAKGGTSTHMTQSALTDVPTYSVEQSQVGSTVYVTITATDQSGIHYIKYKKGSGGSYSSSPVQPQHPASASFSYTVPVTSSTWLYYYAKDDGGNYPEYAESVWVSVSESNHDPELSSGDVDPNSGDTSTTFSYIVHYYDQDGDSPSTRYVYIDGSAHTMSLYSGSASNGTYRYQTTLSAGSHNYYFYFTDGSGGSDTLPSSGSYSGPSVSGVNHNPELSSGDVDPNSGDTSTTFSYIVHYYDQDGDSPSTRYVYIDGSAHTMSLYSGSASNGTYRYQTTLSVGSYNYYFYFTDGNGGSDRLPSSGTYFGPSVSSVKPTVTVTATDPTASELGLNTGKYRISRTGSTASNLSVYFTMSGMAINGADYNTISSPKTISAGSSYVDITLTPKDDSTYEGEETAVLTISTNSAYDCGSPYNATVTIQDDDSSNYTLSVNSSGASGVSISSSTGHSGTTNYTQTVVDGTSINLQAPPVVGFGALRMSFNGWTGSVTSSNQYITFTMNGSKTISANYVSVPPGTWTGIGPEGGVINALAIDPAKTATVYAGTGNGVFKSTDGGASWSPINSGLTNTNVWALAIDPVTTTTVYAGIYGGVFKSTDGGESWSPINSGLTNTNVRALAIDPVTTTTVYAGIYGGVFKSTDGGASWSPINSGLTNTNVWALAIDPVTPSTIYAGTEGGGAYKSTDGGESWSPINSGLTNTTFRALAIDPVTTTTVYAGTIGGGVFKSTDAGASWSPINFGLTNTNAHALAIDPVTTTTVYAGTIGGGVFKSTNGGTSWSPVNSGLTCTAVLALAIDPVTTATIYAGTHGDGAFVSEQDTPQYTLSVNSSGASGVSISSSTGHSGTTNYSKTVVDGTSVNLQAPQYVGSGASRMSFNNWTGSVTSSNPSITFTMDGSKTITANYVSDPVTYNLSVTIQGQGSVSLNPSGGTYDSGTTVQLTPAASPDWHFVRWEEGLSGSTNPATILMDSNKNVTAVFEQDTPQYTLSINSSGASGVSISSSTGHSGTTNYTQTVAGGTSVNLQAPQYIGSGASRMSFNGWTGSVTSSNQYITFTMNSGKTFTANYVSDPVTYTLSATIQGQGSVSLNPSGGTYDSGTTVQLTATASQDWHFVRWEEGLSGSTNPATILMDSNKNVTAVFEQDTPQYTLSVSSSGASGVSISSSTGHSGTTNYTQTVAGGTSVNLQAPQYIGSGASRMSFNGWTGSVTSSNQSITFTMNGSKTVSANYVSDPVTYTLSVNSSGVSGVSISSSTGHSGTTNYTQTVAGGTSVNLQAPQYVGSGASRMSFNGWTGSVTSSSQSITFTMNGSKTVTANYVSDNAGTWISIGPEGGTIYALAIDPVTTTTVYAGTPGGVFKTTDGGARWSQMNSGLTNIYVEVLAIDPVTPSTIYAGTRGGVYKSTNAGASWAQMNSGLTGTDVRALAIDPVTTGTVYAGTYGNIFLHGSVFKSTNGGASWSETGLTNIDISALAIDPVTTGTVYAGTNGSVFKSTNAGASWSTMNSGLTITNVYALAVDPVTPSTVYAGTYGGVFKTTNGGASWSSMNSGLTSTNVWALAIDPVTPSTVYAGTHGGVFKSTDGGASWSPMNSGLISTVVEALAIDPVTPSTVYAGTHGGVFKSTDAGVSWSPINSGLTGTDVRALGIDPVTPSTVYAGTGTYSGVGGVFKSTDAGVSWSPINSGLTNTYVYALAVDPVTPSTVYAGTWGGGVFKTTNGGASWSPMNSGLTNTRVLALGIDPVTPSTVYAGTYGDGIITGGSVFKSTNGGASWSQTGLTNIDVRALGIDPVTPSTVYAGTSRSLFNPTTAGIYKSTNGGASWSPMNSGLTSTWVHSLAIDPVTPSTVYAGTWGGGVFKTTNAGASWSPMNSGLTGTVVEALAIDPVTPSTVYAGTDGGGAFKTTDGGASWSPMNSGLISTVVEALAIDPVTPSTVYAGTHGGGVFVYREAVTATTGDITIDHTWHTVNLSQTYMDSVIMVGPTTYHGTDPGVVRLRNVTNNSFEIRFQEWLYKDGAHTQENIPYLVISDGRHQMPNGSIWEAGTFFLSDTGTWTYHAFTDTFPSTPALFLTTQTYNGFDPIAVRARNVTNTGFEAALFEEESKMDGHATEEVGYLAVYSPQLSGTVNINGTDVPYLLQAQSVDHRFVPVLSSDIKLEEEQSKDTEINHINETVSILALGDKIFTQDISSSGGDTIAIRRLAPEYGAAMEWGTVDGVDHNWMKIPLAKEYMNPVIVAKPVSSYGGDPGVIRIRNASHNSFELRYNEWAYKDGWHTQERVFYMVVEAGIRSVAGLTVEARRLNTSKLLADGWEPITFSAFFSQTPSVFTSVQTYNGADPVITRLRDCTFAGFDLTMDEEEAKNDGHTTETIGWIAIKKGTGNTNDNRSVVVLSSSTSHIPTQINFGQSMARRFPVVVSDMITTYGSNPCFLRYQNLLPSSIDLFIQEEASSDAEMNHTTEDVSLFVGE